MSKTKLPTYLDGLHKHLYLSLNVRPNQIQTTQSGYANTTRVLRPRKPRAWHSFSDEQEEIWQLLMNTTTIEDKIFPAIHTLKEIGEDIQRQLISSEHDLTRLLRQTIEDHLSNIIKELYKDLTLRRTFNLRGYIRFVNHLTTLNTDYEVEDEPEIMNHANQPTPQDLPPTEPERNMAMHEYQTSRLVRFKRPRSNQFCAYNIPKEPSELNHRIAAYVKDIKSPTQVKVNFLRERLEDIDVDDVIIPKNNESPGTQSQRALIALIAPLFDYMIRAGTQVGVLSTGEADVYVRIGDDSSTLLYHLSIPKDDVGAKTGWNPHSKGPNPLHLTAVGQSLAFTLRAFLLPPRSQAWRLQATHTLPIWNFVLADLLNGLPADKIEVDEHDSTTAEGEASLPGQSHQREWKCRIRYYLASHAHRKTANENMEESIDTPSRGVQALQYIEPRQPLLTPRTFPSDPSLLSQENHRQYCTLKCLLGMVNGGELDQACPNVHDHGTTHHSINSGSFVAEL